MPKINKELLLKTLLKNGGDYAELFLEHSNKTLIVLEDKKIETLSSGIDSGVGLRLLFDNKTAYGSANSFDEKVLKNLAADLSRASVGQKKRINFTLKKLKPNIQFTIKNQPQEITLNKRIGLVKKLEQLAWSLDRKIVQVKIRYNDWDRDVEIFNSLGIIAKSPASLISLSAEITLSDGKELVKGYESMGGHAGFELLTKEKTETLVRTAYKRALLNLTAERAKGGTMPVVISSEAGGTLVHEAVGHGLEADLACEGLSVYEGKMGEMVASPLITVVDDPTIPGKRGSYLFDDEGVPSTNVTLIENGVLKNYLHSRLTAMKNNAVSNAHGRRESYAHKPIVRMANTLILPGKDDPVEILKSVNKGLFVKMMGGGQVNTSNGDFMFEVTEGYRIENGKIGEPVRGATLTGSGPEILRTIDKVGNDIGYSLGTCGKDGQGVPVADGMPTVRIPEMVVGGLT